MALFRIFKYWKQRMKQVVMTVEEQLAVALAEVENLRTALADKEAAIAEKDCMIRDLQNKLLWLRKKVFGRMSEKTLLVDPAQLSLFDEKHLTDEERAQLDREVEEAEKTITKTVTVKARPSGEGLPYLSGRGSRRKRQPQG